LARARFAVRAGRENLDEQHRQILGLLRRRRYRPWRTWELKEQLRLWGLGESARPGPLAVRAPAPGSRKWVAQ
jgi:hypothetical protein